MIKTDIIIGLVLISALFTSVVSADETNESVDYNLYFLSGTISPEPMEFGENAGYSNGTFCTASLYSGNATQRKHVYVQFYERIETDEQKQILKNCSIETIIHTAGKGCYITSMPANLTPADIPAESGLRWMGEIPPEDKYDRLYGLNVRPSARMENGQVKLEVWFYSDVTLQDAQNLVSNYSNSLHLMNSNLDPLVFEIITEECNLTL